MAFESCLRDVHELGCVIEVPLDASTFRFAIQGHCNARATQGEPEPASDLPAADSVDIWRAEARAEAVSSELPAADSADAAEPVDDVLWAGVGRLPKPRLSSCLLPSRQRSSRVATPRQKGRLRMLPLRDAGRRIVVVLVREAGRLLAEPADRQLGGHRRVDEPHELRPHLRLGRRRLHRCRQQQAPVDAAIPIWSVTSPIGR